MVTGPSPSHLVYNEYTAIHGSDDSTGSCHMTSKTLTDYLT